MSDHTFTSVHQKFCLLGVIDEEWRKDKLDDEDIIPPSSLEVDEGDSSKLNFSFVSRSSSKQLSLQRAKY